MLTSKKFVSDFEYYKSDKNKRKFESVLKAEFNFKDETRPIDAEHVLHRMTYNKFEDYYPKQDLSNERNKGDLGDYLKYLGLRNIRDERFTDKKQIISFRDENYVNYYFKFNKRKMKLNVTAVSTKINSNLECYLNLENLNHFILTGEKSKDKK
jgi:hypothetical protein